ncbi:hypothetical protein B0H14DRAFT_2587191 [Mycena olivaceomarginata]|nr:hypothetical protein B0H14DRAFT_2587191 [Mycena olivaceomarginata]
MAVTLPKWPFTPLSSTFFLLPDPRINADGIQGTISLHNLSISLVWDVEEWGKYQERCAREEAETAARTQRRQEHKAVEGLTEWEKRQPAGEGVGSRERFHSLRTTSTWTSCTPLLPLPSPGFATPLQPLPQHQILPHKCITARPIPHQEEAAVIDAVYPEWDQSRVDYRWDGLVFPNTQLS